MGASLLVPSRVTAPLVAVPLPWGFVYGALGWLGKSPFTYMEILWFNLPLLRSEEFITPKYSSYMCTVVHAHCFCLGSDFITRIFFVNLSLPISTQPVNHTRT